MLVVISYDVNTEDAAGRRRLRQVAKQCVNYGQRVQNSVFECLLDSAECRRLQSTLCELINPEKDSLRFYFLGNFLGNLLKFLFQAHKHRKVRLSVLLLPYPPKVCLIACRTISQVPSRKWDLVRICNGVEAELRG